MRLAGAFLALTLVSGATFNCENKPREIQYKVDTIIKASIFGADGGNANTDVPTKGGKGGFTDVSFIAHAGTRVRYTVGCSGKNGSGRGTRGGGSGGGGSGIELIRHDGKVFAMGVAGGGGGGAGCFGHGGVGGGISGTSGTSSGFGGNNGGTGASAKTGGKGSKGDRGEPNGQSPSGRNGGNGGGNNRHIGTRSFGFGKGGTSTIRRGDCGGGGGGGGWFGGGGGAAGGHGSAGGGGSGHCNFGQTNMKTCFTLPGDGRNGGNPRNGKIQTSEKAFTTSYPTASPTILVTPAPTHIPLCVETSCKTATTKGGRLQTKVTTTKRFSGTRERWHCVAVDGKCECRCHAHFKCTLMHPISMPGGKVGHAVRNNHC